MTPAQAARRVRTLKAEEVTVELWLRSWRQFFPGELAPSTVEHDDYMLLPFQRALADRLLRDVTRLDAQAWAVEHRSQVRYLRRVWEKARMLALVDDNVWAAVELPPAARRGSTVPSLEQLDRILGRARRRGGWWLQFENMIEVAAFTGARLGGLASLRRSAVDLDARRVVVTEKGAKTRTIVLAPRAAAALARQLERARPVGPDPLVFVSPQGRPLHRNRVGEAWRMVRGNFDGSFHSLKHFAGTWLASLGVEERDIAIQLGHVDAQGRPYVRLLHRVYVHPDHEDARARIDAAVAR